FTHVNTGTCFDDPGVAGNDCGNDPSISADKKSVTWIQNVATNGAPPPDSERAQDVEAYSANECLPSDNVNAAGYNNFCAAKDSSKPYCDTTLKKCYGCSIVNNNPSGSGNPNVNDCPAGSTAKGWVDNPADPNDQLIIGKCDLASGASKGGSCRYFSSCTFNTDCSTSCCSRESVAITGNPGPGEGTGKCVTSFSAGNPINPYLCRVA
ncbi:MAG: hypothetical protein HY516_03755, partial [Candidatus Aenigmarchaeota archaeon]|nr:hypothetical protein [Candidatus Aenigmarchaeota archaeon]